VTKVRDFAQNSNNGIERGYGGEAEFIVEVTVCVLRTIIIPTTVPLKYCTVCSVQELLRLDRSFQSGTELSSIYYLGNQEQKINVHCKRIQEA